MDAHIENQMKAEVEKLGLDYESLKRNGIKSYASGRILQVTGSVPVQDAATPADELGVLVTFKYDMDERIVIDAVFAALLITSRESVTVVSEKNYLVEDGPFPSKDTICNDLAEAYRIQNIREKFGNNENDKSSGKTKKHKKGH